MERRGSLQTTRDLECYSQRMKAAWLLPVTLSLLACSGSSDGPRGGVGSVDQAGTGGMPSNMGGGVAIPTGGAAPEMGGMPSVAGMPGSGGVVSVGGAQAGASS